MKNKIIYGLGGLILGAAILVPLSASAHRGVPDGAQPEVREAIAQVLGYDSVDELKQGHGNRHEAAEEAGYDTPEEFHTALINQIKENGNLSDEEIAETEQRLQDRLQERTTFKEGVAEFLGISVEEFEAAHDNGGGLRDLLDQSDKTFAELNSFLEDKGIERPGHSRHEWGHRS